MTVLELKPGRYSLVRESDGAGDSGPRLIPTKWNGRFWEGDGKNGTIEIGKGLECGSITARSYSAQDFWACTEVQEILEVNEDKTEVKVRTRSGSIYTVKSF